jgi:hypothetical protein
MDDHVHGSGVEKPIVPLHHGPLPLTMISVYGEDMLGLKLCIWMPRNYLTGFLLVDIDL